MLLWNHWWLWVEPLRGACSRTRSFLWLGAAIAGMSVRGDLLGVTGIIRALGFCERFYDRLLDFFHSSALDPDALSRSWVKAVCQRLPGIYRCNGRPVLLGDGIKIPKRGRKMPAVKLLHQVSDSNTKPEYIMGHSIQAVSILVSAASSFFAVPLSARIHEGLVFSNRDHRTLPRKFLSLIDTLGIPEPIYLIADAYYACRTMALGLTAAGSHLISRLRKNAVAYEPIPQTSGKRKRGRPKLYGGKIRLFSLFDNSGPDWTTVDSPVYGEKGVMIRYRCLNLVWRPIRRLARFVLVEHPQRGRIMFLCTDLALNPVEIIRLYGLRFKIETGFKQATRQIGAFAYHFWMKDMTPLRYRNGNQYLHRKSAEYRAHVKRKIHAYHAFIQAGVVAQGLLQYLAVVAPKLVWESFGSWLRTIRPGIPPSEFVVANALRQTLPEFLMGPSKSDSLTKFIADRQDTENMRIFRLAS
jgi:DDE superfamily endonuclease